MAYQSRQKVPSSSDLAHQSEDSAFSDWKSQRSLESSLEVQKHERVPLKLSHKLSVWIPVELTVIVESLWSRESSAVESSLKPVSGETEQQHTVKVWATFLKVVQEADASPEGHYSASSSNMLSHYSKIYLLRVGHAELVKALGGNDIHAVTRGLPNQVEIVRTFFSVSFTVDATSPDSSSPNSHIKNNVISTGPSSSHSSSNKSALISAVEKSILENQLSCGLFAVFGGQGPSWFSELKQLYTTYPKAKTVIDQAATIVLEQSQSQDIAHFFRPHGFQLSNWLQTSDTTLPSPEFLYSAPISCPMILLTQLVNYLICCNSWNLSPMESAKLFKGVTGHSQGLLGASIMATAKTEAQLIQLILDGVRFMVWFGVRLQQAIPFNPEVRNEVLSEAKQLGYGYPTPMLAVLHLEIARLTKYANMVNKAFPTSPERHIEIALRNAPRINVVVGHPESLFQLVTILHRAEMSSKDAQNQNRVPHSKRKREFSCRFLSVSVPFHWSKIGSSVQHILNDASRLGFSLDASGLNIPVWGTDGESWPLKEEETSGNSTNGPTSQSAPSSLRVTNSGPKDLRHSKAFFADLIQMQAVSHVDWVHALIPAARQSGITHMIDFGHGELGGIGALCARNLTGAGIQLISAGSFIDTKMVGKEDAAASTAPFIQDKSALFDTSSSSIQYSIGWGQEFAPKVVKRSSDGKYLLETKFSRALGKPPVMVAGMTPTTVNHHLVAAVLNAGFHGELAGGGLPTESMFRECITSLVEESKIGSGVTLNLLFLNPTQWGMQFPLTAKMAQEGIPIEGLTIGAGVPSLEKATEIIKTLQESGLSHLSFKPGSVDAIQAVIAIAKSNPTMTIMLQWTGGRGGGHHSFEDFHEPILATYAQIRQQPNIVLIGGSGFGDAQDTWPYMNGSWSVAHGHPPMPFDAILVASRVMVAKEAGTSDAAKELIVKTPGIERDEQWESSYDGNAGGVVNVQSELGEPIHKVATRGIMLWRQFDKEFFSLPKEKIGAKIEERKAWIIEKLNSDFQKVYFGKKIDGTVCDLQNMTYSEVLFRMLELQYIFTASSNGTQGRWIHPDYCKLVFDFATRIEERFAGKPNIATWALQASQDSEDGGNSSNPSNGNNSNSSKSKSVLSQLAPIKNLESNPHSYIANVCNTIYPESSKQLLCSEDVDFFISICKQRGRKPVNFIPVIDHELSYWFKKDSLWQSEDLDAVPDQDVQRIVILQGPMAVRYSTKVNEPVADILNGIHDGWIDLYAKENNFDLSSAKAVEHLVSLSKDSSSQSSISSTSSSSPSPSPFITISRKEVALQGTEKPSTQKSLLLKVASEIPTLHDDDLMPLEQWIHWLSSQSTSTWWSAILHTAFVTQQKRRAQNIIPSLFALRSGQEFELVFSDQIGGELKEAIIREDGTIPHFQAGNPMVSLKRSSEDNRIHLQLFHVRPGVSASTSTSSTSRMVPIEFIYNYIPSLGHACIHESLEGRNMRIKKFYSQLWFDDCESKEAAALFSSNPLDATFTHKYVLNRHAIEAFCQVVARTIPPIQNGKLVSPLDFAIVAGWESIVKALFLDVIDGDILQLVHLSNSFKRLSDQNMTEGDVLITTMKIGEIANTPTGQRVSVEGTVSVEGNEKQPLLGLKSAFFFRGNVPFKSEFKIEEDERSVTLSKKEILAIVSSKSWIKWNDASAKEALKVGDRLVFTYKTVELTNVNKKSSLHNILTSGTITKQSKHAKNSTVKTGDSIGTFLLDQKEVKGCVIRGFLQRYGIAMEHPTFFSNTGYQMIVPDKVKVPAENHTYALASRDLNPIHTNPYFAKYAKLPTTITHGMWTSANARRVVETLAAKNQADRVLHFSTEFIGMVSPGDTLITKLKHIGMKNGRMLIDIRTEIQETGQTVLKGSADVQTSKTAYVFTGQGSAEVGMGMDLYASSPIAKSLWDAADVYFLAKYGFSILSIVRSNPKEITIFFGGTTGEAMRRNYQQLTQQVQVKDEESGQLITKEQPLFPQITDSSSSFTFKHPEGLLFATQFSQPALVLVELAAFSDMREKGIIPSDCIFAGHSLGEYAALASVASVLSTESLVDIVFLRGMTMQNAVVRDESGRSPYAMVAVNPGRVHPTHFREAQLNQLITAITQARPELLQVVNYNVDNYQYVVAGERANLNALGFVLNALQRDLKGASSKMPEIIAQAIKQAVDSKDPVTGVVPLERGMATIPLPGIDVPFHSRFLKDGVPPFRRILQQRMDASALNKDLLIGRYIPNVTAAPFSLSKDYIDSVFQNTQSAVLQEILNDYEQEAQDPQKLAFKLLIELLAYQFASPVRWIETQHLFFATLNVERFIEVGPAPTLFAMAKRTLESGQFSPLVSREVLWYGRDKSSIYYQIADVEAEDTSPSQPAPQKQQPKAVVAPVAQPVAPAPATAAAAPASSVPDSPASALEFIQTLVSLRLKKPVNQVSENDTIKAIVAGKSALQNELLGDLETEFGTKMPEGASEASLSTIAKQMGSNYKQLGKVGNTIVHKLVSNKMPGGYSMTQVKSYLSKTYGLGEGKSQSILLHAATMEPANRASSEAEGNAFLDSVVSSYGHRTGQTFSAASAASSSSAPAQISSISSSFSSTAAASIPDEPVSALHVLRVLISLKVKKSIDQVTPTSTIKDLVGGKSALQNELVGDVQKEFGQEPGDGASEMDLKSLASRVGANYTKLGPFMTASINKLVSSKMPGGFGLSQVKSYLNSRFGLGDGRTDSALVHSLLLEPQARLSTEGEANGWLDHIAQDYASKNGISLGSVGSGAGNSGASGGRAVVDSAALKAFESKYNAMIREHLAVYHEYLGEDPLASEKVLQLQQELRKQAEHKLDTWVKEHGGTDVYFEGITPVFDTKKERRYDSSWNWNRQDCLQLYYDYACGRSTQWTIDIRERLYHIKNRATPHVVDMVEHYLKKSVDDGHGEIKAFIQILADTLRFVMDDLPKYREHKPPCAPDVQINVEGIIQYREVPRIGVKDMTQYVAEMRKGPKSGVIYDTLSKSHQHHHHIPQPTSSSQPFSGTSTEHASEIRQAIKQLEEAKAFLIQNKAPQPVIDGISNQLSQMEKAANLASGSVNASTPSPVSNSVPTPNGSSSPSAPLLPYVFLRRQSIHDPSHRSFDAAASNTYLDVLEKMSSEGLCLPGKTCLIIGCGKGSIGVEILKGMLRAGAKVIATTSRFSAESSSFYHKIFDKNGSKGSELIVLPFNQGSLQDVQSIVNHIYDKEQADLDYIIPFAALPENGRDIGDLDGRSELAHRIMLTNVLRLIGAIKEKKKSLAIVTRPAHVLLPLSPNHGIFGFDGLYAESKLGLEALLTKWHSEGWKTYLSLAGAIIGWTRGTGLMNHNNVVAAGIEKLGARTFSTQEMCFNLMGLLHPEMVRLAQNDPVLADLNGCLHLVPDLNDLVRDLRASLIEQASIKKAVAVENSLDHEVETGKQIKFSSDNSANNTSAATSNQTIITQRANVKVEFPPIPTSQKELAVYEQPRGMLNLENVVVIVGFGEIGPYGSSRTRWEMESYGEFSLEGCIELAWIMGLIKYQHDPSKSTGWIDTATGARVADHEIKSKYEAHLLQHTGIRLVEPELFSGYDPHNKMFLHQVALNKDMAPMEVSKEEADAFKRRHADALDVYQEDTSSDTWFVKLRKGAVLYIPKALKFDRFVAGQIPSTWDAATLGIPADIINQVDRVTLFSLASTVEALVSAGVTDPYEFYQYVHVSEVGNTFGGGFGGMESIRRTYRNRLLDMPVQGDILQETFINTVGAWLNMLLLSSSGPIKTPVGACATAVESVEIGVDTIKSGKAKIVIAGGYDDFGEEGSYEFGNMKATANNAEELAIGRTPKEMSRPTTSTRSGFVESQGAGTQILMTAELAIKMGVPIYAIVEHVNTATDKVGRSVPAPGQGILTTAKENHSTFSPNFTSPLLDMQYRRKHLETELRLIEAWRQTELDAIQDLANQDSSNTASSDFSPKQLHSSIAFGVNQTNMKDWVEHIELESCRRKKVAYSTWSNDFYKNNPRIAPLRGALAVYGLTVDDIAVASFHGTSTKGNDLNESQVIQKQLEHLGRSKGNVILTIFQKYLTGHPKGAAAAWMLNGLVQSMLTGIVPGNRNADNIDPKLRDLHHIVFLNRSLFTYGYKAGLLKSFGFGQVGGEVLIIHPNFILAQLTEPQLKEYMDKRNAREHSAYRHWQDSITGKCKFIQVKDHPPYTPEDESRVYLDPLARATFDQKSKSWSFPSNKKKGAAGASSGSADSLSKNASTSSSSSIESSLGNQASKSSSSNLQALTSSSLPSKSNPSQQNTSALGPGRKQSPSPSSSTSSTGLKRNLSNTALNHMEVMMREMGEGLRTTIDRGIGVDAQLIDEIEVSVNNTDFVTRNFTPNEIAYCRASPDPSSSFAGRWAAKEAVIKAISSCDADNSNARNLWQGAGGPLRDIEIVPSGSGAPQVHLTGHAADVAALLSISTIKVAISHSGDYAIAQAIAR